MMRELGDELGVQVDVYGPEASMTGICQVGSQLAGRVEGGQ